MTDSPRRPLTSRWVMWLAVIVCFLTILAGAAVPLVMPIVQLSRAVKNLREAGIPQTAFDDHVLSPWQEQVGRRIYQPDNLLGARVLDFVGVDATDDTLISLRPFPTLVNVDLHGQSISSAGIVNIQEMPIKWLKISETMVGSGTRDGRPGTKKPTVPVAPGLGSLTDLEMLDAADSLLADEDLTQLRHLTRMEVLNLNGTCVTSDGMVSLATIPALKYLYLDRTAVDDQGLSKLTTATKLVELSLSGTKLTGAGFRGFSAPELRGLHLYDALINNEGAANISRFSELRVLDLKNCQVTDQGCKLLSKLRHLQSLDLTGCPVTDGSVESLLRIQSLTSLSLGRTEVTKQGIGRLKGLLKLATLEISSSALSDMELVSELTRFPKLTTVVIRRSVDLRLNFVEVRERLGEKIYLSVLNADDPFRQLK